MLDRNIDSIIYQSYIKLGEIALKLAENADNEGTLQQKNLWNKAIRIDSLLDTILDSVEIVNNKVYRTINIEDKEINKFLNCLKDVAEIYDFPIAPFIPSKDPSKIISGQNGTDGAAGANGVNAYVYIAFGDDTNGTGFTLINNDAKDYMAILTTSTPLTPPLVGNFTGLWFKRRGATGPIGGDIYFSSIGLTAASSPAIIDRFPITDALAVRWDFLLNSTAQRAGSVIATWIEDGTVSNGQELSTIDINGLVEVTISFTIVGTEVRLIATITGAGTWNIQGRRFYIPGSSLGVNLPTGKIFIGDSNGLPAAQTMSKHATIAVDGQLTIANDVITNSHINSNAGIQVSKLETLTPNKYVGTDNTGKVITVDPPSVPAPDPGFQLPAGVILDYAGATPPTGFLFCAGQLINRITYSALFSAIGVQYGAGDGSTTFKLPDYRGKVGAGKDDMGGLVAGILTDNTIIKAKTLGATGGKEKHTLSISEMPTHKHTGVTGSMNSNKSHNHTFDKVITTLGNTTGGYGGGGGYGTTTTNSTNIDHTHNIPNEGGGSSHNNVQPTIIVNKIIKI
jgi:microcystin-dependent protein